MKLLSLNLHCFKEDNQIEKWNRIIDFIRNESIDVCLFQEACQDRNGFKIDNLIRVGNNASYIANALGYNIYFHPIKIGFEIYEEGLAIVSKKEIKKPFFKTISKTSDFNNWLKRDFLRVQIDGYTFYNVHLGWGIGNEIPMNQISNLLMDTDLHEERIFVAGDFNFPDNSEEIKLIKKHLCSISDLAKVDSLMHPTFHFPLDSKEDYNGNRMIDFIFTNTPLKIKSFRIVFNEEEEYVSDHSGVFVEI